MRPLLLFPILAALAAASALSRAEDDEKPVLEVEADGFPSGRETPEGAAADLARAAIRNDAELYRRASIAPFGDGESRAAYVKFLEAEVAGLKARAAAPEPAPANPVAIKTLFAARRLTFGGPVSAGYAMHGFHDIIFVDLELTLGNGDTAPVRNLMIKDADNRWFVHPAPHLHPILSTGLSDETASEKPFGEAYTVEKSSE